DELVDASQHVARARERPGAEADQLVEREAGAHQLMHRRGLPRAGRSAARKDQPDAALLLAHGRKDKLDGAANQGLTKNGCVQARRPPDWTTRARTNRSPPCSSYTAGSELEVESTFPPSPT